MTLCSWPLREVARADTPHHGSAFSPGKLSMWASSSALSATRPTLTSFVHGLGFVELRTLTLLHPDAQHVLDAVHVHAHGDVRGLVAHVGAITPCDD